MTIERVLGALELISGFSDEEIAKYAPIARKNMDLLQPNRTNLNDADEGKLAYLVAAKTNLEIALINSQCDNVKSFSAGDVKITHGDNVGVAREIYSSALEDVSDIISDSAFCFRSV